MSPVSEERAMFP